MVYVDTSALVPLFIREAKSDALIVWLEESEERVAISDWGLVEFVSAAAIKVRTGHVTQRLATQAFGRAVAFARRHCKVTTPGRGEFSRAAEIAGVPALNLRAGDALHLAIAESLGARGILCFDEVMAKGARSLGIRVVGV